MSSSKKSSPSTASKWTAAKSPYGNINAQDATAIFIRSALVEENLLPGRRPAAGENDEADDDDTRVLTSVAPAQPPLPPPYRFITHNRAIREKIENWRTPRPPSFPRRPR